MNQTLVDKLNRPLQDLRISVIDRCNFRCPYCMPAEEKGHTYQFSTKQDILSFEEILRLTNLFVQLGVTKIRLTGGEPLLRKNLPSLISQLNQLSNIEDLALTTNGSLLEQYAKELKENGLRRLTVSLDSVDAHIFKLMTGKRGRLHNTLKGIEAAEKAGFDKIKLNVMVQKGVNDHTILNIIQCFKGTGHIVRFIEYMDVGNCNHWQSEYVVPSKELVEIIQEQFPIQPTEANYFGEVARRYTFVDGTGEIGFISSVTQPFCQSCTRARLSTNGKFYTCLFASDGLDLRTPLRDGASDKEILSMIHQTWIKRDDRYSELRPQIRTTPTKDSKVEMFHIGG